MKQPTCPILFPAAALTQLLDEADSSGKALIRRRDGRTFAVAPESSTRSPLDGPGIDTGVTTEEILEYLREGRDRGNKLVERTS
jgi:hypothetical protein